MKFNDALLRWVVLSLIACALAAATGRLAVHTVNDSPSYQNYPLDSLVDAMLSIRTPGYPIFLALVRSAVGLAAVPLIQVLLHATASWFVGEELLTRGMPLRCALASAFCVLIGCTAADHINTISTDAPAASLGIVTAVFLMRACRRASTGDAVACMIFAAVTIFVRPAYLFLIPWLAVAGWLLDRVRSMAEPTNAPTTLSRPTLSRPTLSRPTLSRQLGWKIALGVVLILLGWMSLRKAVVSDFGIVPFGHQNLSALLVQTVPPSTLGNLPGRSGALGRRIASELEQQGFELPGQRGSLPTLTMESQWDQINYGVVWPIAKQMVAEDGADDSIASQVRVHRRIGELNRSILKTAPGGYLRWLLLAVRRSVWGTAANIAMHPIFLVMILIGLAGLLVQASRGRSLGPITAPAGWSALAVVAITYAVFSIGFVILTSPPIGRFADAGAIFLPGLLVSLLVAPRKTESLRSSQVVVGPRTPGSAQSGRRPPGCNADDNL